MIVVNKLRTQDINRIINRFNINIINAKTISFDESTQNMDEFINYIFEISDDANINIAKVSRTSIDFDISQDHISSRVIGAIMGYASELDSGDTTNIYLNKNGIFSDHDELILEYSWC